MVFNMNTLMDYITILHRTHAKWYTARVLGDTADGPYRFP